MPTGTELDAAPNAAQPGRSLDLGSSGAADLGDSSAACAIVAGVAALILSVNPDLTAPQVQQILEQTADKIGGRPENQHLGRHNANPALRLVWLRQKSARFKAVQLAQQQLRPLLLPYRWVEYVNADPLEIPDGRPEGVTSALQVQEADLIRDIEVSLEIEHEFMGDLALFLLPPWGEEIVLQGRGLGHLSRLKTIYSLETTAWLKPTLNRSAQGEWRLRVVDWVPSSRGKLQSWRLNLGL